LRMAWVWICESRFGFSISKISERVGVFFRGMQSESQLHKVFFALGTCRGYFGAHYFSFDHLVQ
jgi:hypothetical protein